MTLPRRALLPAVALALGIALAACGSGAPGPVSSGSGTSAEPAPTAVPGGATAPATDPGAGVGDGGTGGGGTGGNPGTGILDPGQIGGIFDPAPGPDGEPTIVTPAANVHDLHDVNATKVEAAVDGRAVAVRVSWWSGVEPCTALAGIDVTSDRNLITLTVKEGSAAEADVFCTEQAIYKAAVIDLGELEPGSWTIVATGEAPPITVEIAG
jgi:hypothetical protein